MRPRLVAAVSLSLGAVLYVAGRPTSLRLFEWADAIGLGGIIQAVRDTLAPIVLALPEVVLWSVPFGLWVLAATVMLGSTRWAAAPLVLAVAAELGQLVGLAPGTFDPVDLFVVLAAGAFALHGAAARREHPRPEPIMLAFAVLAAGTSQTEEEKAASEKERAENLAKLGEYTKTLQKVHDDIAKLDLEALEPKSCKSVKVELPKDSTGLRTVAHGFLARFGKDKSAWTKPEGGWAFLTDSGFGGHFEQHVDDRQAYAIADTAKRVQETFLPEKYLVVVAFEDDKYSVLPSWKKGDKLFDSGYFVGWIFLADQQSGDLACQVRIEVESSKEVDWGGLLDSNDSDKELLEDFEDNFEAAINKVLPSGVEIGSSYGSIVR